jgi:hypothetical protein
VGSKGSGVPPSALLEAPQKLAGELGIVTVLSERELGVGSLRGAAGTEPRIHVRLGDLRGLGFDDEPKRIA